MKHATTMSLVALVAMLPACEEAADVAGWDPMAGDTEPAAAAGETPPTVDWDVEVRATPLLFVSDQWSEATPPPSGRAFSVLDTGALFFYGYFPILEPGGHVARLDIYGPDGALYKTLSQPFTLTGEDRSIASGEAHAERTPMGVRVVLDLPVAGTPISRYALTGTWRADLLLDVVAGDAEAQATFELYSPAN